MEQVSDLTRVFLIKSSALCFALQTEWARYWARKTCAACLG